MHAPVGGVLPVGHVPQTHAPPVPPPGPPPPPTHEQLVPPYTQGPSAAHAAAAGVHAPASGCDAGHAVHVVHVHTGFAPPPHSHTTSPPYVHVPSPVAQADWLFGAVVGQLALLPPLLLPEPLPELPLLEPLPLPDALPLLEPLDDEAEPLLLLLVPPLLPVPPLLLLALPPLLLALASEPLLPDVLAPPHAGKTSATTLIDAQTTVATLRARMEVPPRKERPT